MYSTVIFDLDGTLVDSSPGIITAVQRVLASHGYAPLTSLECEQLLAISPIQSAFKQLLKVTDELAQNFSDEYRYNYLSGDLYNSACYPMIVELLNFLQKNNIKLGIASYKREDTLIDIIRYLKLESYFQVICGSDSKNKLTKSDILQKCITELNVVCSDVLYIGDSFSDCEAAKIVGCTFIGVSYGYGITSQSDLINKEYLFMATSSYELFDFLVNLIDTNLLKL